MAQKPKGPSFLEKSADQRISADPCFDRQIFRKLVFFWGFCGLFCALANTLQTAGKSGVSGPKNTEKRASEDRTSELRELIIMIINK